MREKYSLLAVDDENPVLRYIQSIFFSEDDIEILLFEDTEQALKILYQQNPTIVLLDIHMGEKQMDGITFIQKARRLGYWGIICIFTGDPSPELVFRAAISGADDFIVKGSSCNLVKEVRRLIDEAKGMSESPDLIDPIVETAFLRSLGFRPEQAKLLSDYAALGYPRLKELSNRLGITETGLWKRLSRIRDRLGMDSMAQVANLLTSLNILGKASSYQRDRA